MTALEIMEHCFGDCSGCEVREECEKARKEDGKPKN